MQEGGARVDAPLPLPLQSLEDKFILSQPDLVGYLTYYVNINQSSLNVFAITITRLHKGSQPMVNDDRLLVST